MKCDAASIRAVVQALDHPWLRGVNGSAANTNGVVPLDAAVLVSLETYAASTRMRKVAIRAMARCDAARRPWGLHHAGGTLKVLGCGFWLLTRAGRDATQGDGGV